MIRQRMYVAIKLPFNYKLVQAGITVIIANDHSWHHPHRSNDLATKGEKWNGKLRLECVNGHHPPSKTQVRVLPWTCRSEWKWPSRQTEGKWPSRQTSRQSNPHKRTASRKIWSVEELETLLAGAKPGTSHHRSPGGERRGKRKCYTIFVERTREGHRLSDRYRSRLTGDVGETSERRGEAHKLWAFPSA